MRICYYFLSLTDDYKKIKNNNKELIAKEAISYVLISKQIISYINNKILKSLDLVFWLRYQIKPTIKKKLNKIKMKR